MFRALALFRSKKGMATGGGHAAEREFKNLVFLDFDHFFLDLRPAGALALVFRQ